jgi:hypothetical protein
VTDWATVASLATAGGTLVLAVATFASIRSANRSARTAERAARVAERSLLAGQRPLLVTSRLEDPEQELQFTEGKLLAVRGGEAAQPLVVSVLYGDFEGGQRVISQFILRHQGERCLVSAGRHFQIDQPDPREGE